MSPNKEDWKELCRRKKQAQLDAIPSEWVIEAVEDDNTLAIAIPQKCGLLTPMELEITETTDIELLLRKLHSGQWSSVAVTTAFYKRAIIAQQLTNCLTEIFVERALERAQALDNHLKTTGNVVGPLHGLPISLKDQFVMKGLETVMGYVSGIGNYADYDCVLVEMLYELGAVPFVRTNVPQTLIWGETFNHVFGRTTNPYNRRLTPGGSSGGEGALVAMKGSPIGVGTDIGGSVRIPSAFCGLYGLRPSYERLPYHGAANAQEGQETISSALGPMSNSMSGVKAFTKAIIDGKPWNRDPLALRKPWDEREYALEYHGKGGKMCFAIMWDNDVVRPHPPLMRAMKMTKAALEAEGHTVIDWVAHRHMELYTNGEKVFVADAGHDYRYECEKSGEPVIKNMKPQPGEKFEIFPALHGIPLSVQLVGKAEHINAWDLWQLHKEKRELRKSYLDHWERTVNITGTGRPVDAIISPVAAYCAVPHGLNIDCFYTTLCNLLDYSSCAFPVTFANPKLDPPEPRTEFHNEEDKSVHEFYSPELFEGCPVGLQLMGRPQEEEAVIAMTELVDKALQRSKAKSN